MRTSWRFVFAAGSLFAALAWLPAGNGDKDKRAPGGRPLKVVLESKGYVIPVHIVQVAPEVSGRVFQLNFEEGTQVKKGDVLAQLDPARFEIETKRALAVAERARALFQQRSNGYRPEEIKLAELSLQEAVEQRRQVQAELQQLRDLSKVKQASFAELLKADGRLRMAEIQVQKAEVALKAMRAGPRVEEVAAARAELAAAEAELASATYLLNSTRIRAPFDGTILTKKAEEGSLVNPTGFSGATSVCELADLTDLEVEVFVEERDLPHVFRGQKCAIRAEAFPARVYKGVVARLLPVADRARGALPVRVRIYLPKDEVNLRPEMGAVVSFFAKE